MPYVKCISGHTSARGVQRYLEKDGRALATDFLNLDAPVKGVRDGHRALHFLIESAFFIAIYGL